MMSQKKGYTQKLVYIEEETWRAFKAYCISNGDGVNEGLNTFIKVFLKKKKVI